MQKKIRQMFLVCMDVGLLFVSYIMAFLLRFEFDINGVVANSFFTILLSNILILLLIKVLIFKLLSMYDSLWKYASVEEAFQIILAMFVATASTALYLHLRGFYLPRSIYIITLMVDTFLIGGFRFSYRGLRRFKDMDFKTIGSKGKNILIIGAGDAGISTVKEIRRNPSINYNVVGFIDDDKSKHGQKILGAKVFGGRNEIEKIVLNKRVDEVIISIPSANKKDIREIVDICSDLDCTLKTLPALSELIDGKVVVSDIRNIKIEDLLGRDEIELDTSGISEFLSGKTVLVTGGGGSIGSELCRQIMKYNPKKLMILDIYENTTYEIQLELKRAYPDMDITVLIASVRDKVRLDNIFEKYRPEVVFHAAAHKHVPLMEDSPFEAIKNNVFGTYNVAEMADKYSAQKMILISTDKAVNPTNIMGSSKRIAELIVQSKNINSATEYVAVRFGNVLGSNGSVIPLFKRQIEAGGPVTVTHKDVTRFFMTIPEATQLVIQAGSIAKGGEIFILDMGESVKIIDLAKDVITLSGLRPYEDIDIEIIGLRPGEKLYEELLLSEEGVDLTHHKSIFVAMPYSGDVAEFYENLKKLELIIDKVSKADLIKEIKTFVPTMVSEFE
ncbi:MAG: nucleoside-diphosphate sugar epimerase/dehydratase [Acidaminobacteraceae bacterium]